MPLVWEAGVVAAVEDPLFRFQVSGVARPDDWFNLGVVMFDDGENATVDLEIESWTRDGWITMSFAPPNNILTGVALRLRKDGDKNRTEEQRSEIKTIMCI